MPGTIGFLLRYANVIPISKDSIGYMCERFCDCVNKVLKKNNYKMCIRDRNRVPAFGLTVTFQKRRFGKKPKITAFIDGPIVPNTELPPKEQAADLQTKVTETMKSRAKANTYTYINYIKLTQ